MPSQKPLRLWPGVVAAGLVSLMLFVVPVVVPDNTMYGMIGGVFGGVAIVLWWVLFSRAPWLDRAGAIVVMILALLATSRLVDASVANAGMGMMLPIFGIPVVGLGLVAAAAAARRLSPAARRASIVGGIAIASSTLALLRTGGISGSGVSDLHWRWTKTPEERLLAQAGREPVDTAQPPAAPAPPTPRAAAQDPETPPASTPAAVNRSETPPPANDKPGGHITDAEDTIVQPEWPGFRGADRDSVVRGVQIKTDWAASPPVQMWRRAVGPGWSSFAVQGDVFYTQEQRGDDEIVGAYAVSTGEPVWRHRDRVRFWESNGGAGPRATPTLHRGRVYAFGATGVLNALEARSGAVVWSRNAGIDTHVKVPTWGFSSSPLVIGDVVIVTASGAFAAYDAASGKPRWSRASHGGSYSSPHLATLDGVPQVLLLNAAGATSVSPADGTVLWDYAWPGGTPIVQPVRLDDHDVLTTTLAATGGEGVRRLAVARNAGRWNVEERWTSTGLKPYFNDLVVHKGHAFGFDGSILSCIDLEDGTRKWKGGRYGNGQLVLLPDQDLLLVVTEEGELALVQATPEKFTELARVPAVDGKTWNHPVIVGDILLVRNGQEMAAFRLPMANR